MNNVEITSILNAHRKWIHGEPGGERANLSGANLSGANLSGANLYRANLYRANLSEADLYIANLNGADLSGANLSGANLSGADLSDSDLSGANLNGANLNVTNLSGANLYRANLYIADLSEANLSGANLYRANLSEANLRKSKNIPFIPMACPEIGEYIAFKKADNCIVKLRITSDALRSSATGRKCRASKAEVLAIETLEGLDAGISKVHSDYDSSFIYNIGEIIEIRAFDRDRWNECAPGIHHFINRQEAVEYYG